MLLQSVQNFCFLSSNMQIFDVLVAVVPSYELKRLPIYELKTWGTIG